MSFFHRHSLVFWLVPLGAAAAVSLLTIGGQFVQDDNVAIVTNPVVLKNLPVWEVFQRDFWGSPIAEEVSVWRPLMPLVWKWIWHFEPNSPMVYRLLTLFLHALATLSVLWCGIRLGLSRKPLWLGAVIFAVHPVHSEVIGGIVSQADILSTAFGTLALGLVLNSSSHWKELAAVLIYILACLAKEIAVVFSVTIIIAVCISGNRNIYRKLATTILFVLPTALFVWFNLSLDRSWEPGNGLQNLALAATPVERFVYGLYIIGRGATMCFLPLGLAPFHGYAAVDLQYSSLLPYAIPGMLIFATGSLALLFAARSRNLKWAVGLCLFFGPLVFHSNWLFVLGTNLAERLLYTSSVASSVMLAALLCRSFGNDRYKYLLALIIISLFLFQSWRVQRNWRSNESLYRHAVEAEPLSWRARKYYGTVLVQREKTKRGAWYYLSGRWIETGYQDGKKREEFYPILWIEEHIPADKRYLEAPPVLYPEAPCRLVTLLLLEMSANLGASCEDILPRYVERYGPCVKERLSRSSEDAEGRARPGGEPKEPPPH